MRHIPHGRRLAKQIISRSLHLDSHGNGPHRVARVRLVELVVEAGVCVGVRPGVGRRVVVARSRLIENIVVMGGIVIELRALGHAGAIELRRQCSRQCSLSSERRVQASPRTRQSRSPAQGNAPARRHATMRLYRIHQAILSHRLILTERAERGDRIASSMAFRFCHEPAPSTRNRP